MFGFRLVIRCKSITIPKTLQIEFFNAEMEKIDLGFKMLFCKRHRVAPSVIEDMVVNRLQTLLKFLLVVDSVVAHRWFVGIDEVFLAVVFGRGS